jgi:four helix bundle protein
VQDFKKLRVWHESVSLAMRIYEATTRLPDSEKYGLSAQMRSAVASISSNIAEGCGRARAPDKARFLQIAIGSASELESQILLATSLHLLEDDVRLLDQVEKVRRQLIRLKANVERKT